MQQESIVPKSSFILALSGSAKNVDVCLTFEDKLISHLSINGSSASSMLVSTIDKLLLQAGISISQVGLIAVNVGPGSFTSTRVVVVVANSIAWARKIPVVGINAFEVMFQKYRMIKSADRNSNVYLCALDAYSGQIYTTAFNESFDSLVPQACLTAENFFDNIKSKFAETELFWLLDGVKNPEGLNNVFDLQTCTVPDSFALAYLANKKASRPECLALKVSVNYVKEGFYNKK